VDGGAVFESEDRDLSVADQMARRTRCFQQATNSIEMPWPGVEEADGQPEGSGQPEGGQPEEVWLKHATRTKLNADRDRYLFQPDPFRHAMRAGGEATPADRIQAVASMRDDVRWTLSTPCTCRNGL